MNEFYPPQNVKLELKIAEKGFVFLFYRAHGLTDTLVQVPQSWMNIHRLLSRLRKGRTYCAKDVPLLVWSQGEELHIKFHSPNEKIVEECVFTGEEARELLTKLEKLPNLN